MARTTLPNPPVVELNLDDLYINPKGEAPTIEWEEGDAELYAIQDRWEAAAVREHHSHHAHDFYGYDDDLISRY